MRRQGRRPWGSRQVSPRGLRQQPVSQLLFMPPTLQSLLHPTARVLLKHQAEPPIASAHPTSGPLLSPLLESEELSSSGPLQKPLLQPYHSIPSLGPLFFVNTSHPTRTGHTKPRSQDSGPLQYRRAKNSVCSGASSRSVNYCGTNGRLGRAVVKTAGGFAPERANAGHWRGHGSTKDSGCGHMQGSALRLKQRRASARFLSAGGDCPEA